MSDRDVNLAPSIMLEESLRSLPEWPDLPA